MHPRTDRRRNSGQRELVESGTEMSVAGVKSEFAIVQTMAN